MADQDPWGSVRLQQWQANPGQPTGVGQVAPEIDANRTAAQQGQPLDPWASVDFTSAAQSWFGGRNTQGTENGWDSPFYREMIRQQDEWLQKAKDADSPSLYYDRFDTSVNKEATGIVTWNDEARGLHAGDVFENGEKTGNLFELYGERDAATMMAPLLFDGTEQARLFEQGDTESNQPLIDATWQRIAEMTTLVDKGASAEEFRDLTAEKKEMLDEGVSDAGSFAAGAGAGALTGAGLGSIIPGLGTAAGALLGTAIGGISSWLNRDQMTELASRTLAEAEIAGSQEGGFQAGLAHLRGWSGVAMQAASPMQNTVQGVFDITDGDLGDGISSFYEVDENGDRKAGGVVQTINLVASVGDAFSQFASGPARGLYYASMGAQVAAGVGQLTTGQVFDPTAGRYRDLQGGGEWAAAIGSVGIDAVQLGVTRALVRSTASQRALVGEVAPASDALAATVLGRAAQRTRSVAGGAAESVERAVDRTWAAVRGKQLPANYTTQEVNGVKFFFGEDLSAPVASRLTAQILAPSEFTKWVPVGWRARNRMAVSNGMPSADDVYNSALELAKTGTSLSNGIINAFGESFEEGAQAYLDPITYGESAGLNEIAQGAAMGFAAGFGMSLGATLKAPSQQQRAQLVARRNYELNIGRKLTADEWRQVSGGMSEAQLATWATADPKQIKELADAVAEATQLLNYETGTMNTLGAHVGEIAQEQADKEAWNATVPASGGIVVALPRTNSFLLAGNSLDDTVFEANEAVMSLWRIAEVLDRKASATAQHGDEIATLIEEATAERDRANAAGDVDAAAAATNTLAALQEDLADVGDSVALQRRIAQEIRDRWEDFRTAPDATSRQQVVEVTNTLLRNLGQGRNGDGTAVADARTRDRHMRAVELFFGRHPYMDSGSVVRWVPQVSVLLSEQNQHSSIHLPQTSLKAPGADYDGDFLASLNTAYVPPSKRREFRLGGQYLTTESKGDPRTAKARTKVVIDVPDAERDTLDRFRQFYLDPSSEEVGFIERELTELETWVRDRYEPVLGVDAVTKAWSAFRADVQAGVKTSRIALVESLLNTDLQAFIRLGEETGVPEANRFLERVSLSWERVGMRIAAHNHTKLENDSNLNPAQIAQQRSFIRERSGLMTDTYGAMIALGLSQDGLRSAQQLNYLAMVQTAISLEGVVDTDAVIDQRIRTLALEYRRLSSSNSQTALEEVEATDVVGATVRSWLIGAAQQFVADNPSIAADFSIEQLALMVGSLQVRSFKLTGNDVVLEDGSISVLQMLLRAAVQQEEARLARRGEPADSAASLALRKAKRFTEASKDGHSYAASAAMLHVYGPVRTSELIGEDHALIGADAPVNLIVKQMTSKSEEQRAALISRITKESPTWRNGVSDPPYTLETILERQVNPYTVLTNAIRAVANNHDVNMERRNATAHKDAIAAFGAVQRYISTQFEEVAARIRKQEGSSREVTRSEVLNELLTYDAELGRLLAQMMPVDSIRATFAVNPETNDIVSAKWVNEALLLEGEGAAEKAALMFFVYSHLDHLRLLNRGVADQAEVENDPAGTAAKATNGIPYDKLVSRFEQTIFLAQLDPTGTSMRALEQAMFMSSSLDEMFEQINSNPMLRGGRAKLLPYYDDVVEYEVRPTDLFNKSMPSATLRDQYKLAAERLGQLSAQKAQEVAARRAEAPVIRDALARIEQLGGSYSDTNNPRTQGFDHQEVDDVLEAAKELIERAKHLVDGVGYSSRDQAMAAVQEGLLIMSNKGVGDPNLTPLGALLPLVSSFGLKQGVLQELDNLTVFEVEDVMANLSKLMEGPTRVTLRDGSFTTIDLTTVKGFFEMLADPVTNGLAKAATMPTVRDTTVSGGTQLYSVYDGSKGLLDLMAQTTNAQLMRNGSRVDLMAAHNLLSQVEAMALKAVEHLPASEKTTRQQYTLAIQNILNDFLVAYAVGPRKGGSDKKVRDKLVRDVAQTLIEVSQLSPEAREKAKKVAVAKLVEQMTKSSTMREYLALPEELRETAKEEVALTLQYAVDDRLEELEDKLRDTTDPVERAEIEAEMQRLSSNVDSADPLDLLMALDQRTFLDIARAREMYKMDWTDEVTAQASAQRLLKFITTYGRLLHFRQPKVMTMVHNLEALAPIFQQTGAVTLETLGDNTIADADGNTDMKKNWDLLAEWAARAYIQERVGPIASIVGFSAIKSDQEDAYFDPTYSFLIDKLFDDTLLDSMKSLTDRSGFNASNEMKYNSESVATRLVQNLFSEDQITFRSPLYPAMAMAVRKALSMTPVKNAIPQAGDNPKDLFDAIGASMASYRVPLGPEYLSQHTISGKVGDSVKSVVAQTPEMFVKLEHHFVKSIKITDTAGLLPPEEQDALLVVGRTGLNDEVVANSPYRVLSLDRLEAHIASLVTDYKIQDYVVEIEYVDVDKMPYAREWANNVFFEGVGREYETNAGNSLVSSLFFTTEAINKTGQQAPLEYSKDAESGFLAYIMQPRGRREQLESQASSVTELMRLLALDLWTREYETGSMQMADLPSLHKLVRMRNVVRRVDDAGLERLMMVDEAIALETAELAAGKPVASYKVIPLGERQARSIWAAASTSGLKGRYFGQRVLNPQDVDPFPQLTTDRLKRLGLTALGREVSVSQTEFAQIRALPPATLREAEPPTTKGDGRIYVSLEYDTTEELKRRALTDGFKYREINAQLDDMIERMFVRERGLAKLLAGTSVRHALSDPTLAMTEMMARNAAQLRLSDQNVTFMYQMGDVSGMLTGTLTPKDMADDFGWKGKSPVRLVAGDAVIIDLGNILAYYDQNQERAFTEVTKVLAELSKYQVRVALMSTTGVTNQLRSDVSEWIEQGNILYQPMLSSRYFFEPTTERNATTATERAVRRSLSQTRVFTARGARVALGINDDMALHDGAVYYDLEHMDDWLAEQVVELPSTLSYIGAGRGREYTFGLVRDKSSDGNVRARLAADLGPVLATEEGRKSLGMKDPAGVPVRRVTTASDGREIIEPGIVSAEDALLELARLLDNPEEGLYEGRTLRAGDIIPYIDSNGNVVLYRFGFKLPKDGAISKALNTPVAYPGATRPLRIAVAAAEIEKGTTIPADFRVDELHYLDGRIRVMGKARLDANAKQVVQGQGAKLGFTELPAQYAPAVERLSLMPENLLRVNFIVGESSMADKGATQYRVDNFSDAFAFFGISFKQDLMDFFGKDWDTTQRLLEAWTSLPIKMDEAEVLEMLQTGQFYDRLRDEAHGIFGGVMPSTRIDSMFQKPETGEDVTQRIAQVVLSMLLIPGVRLEHVLETSGLLNLDSLSADAEIIRMPDIMSQAFDDRYSYPNTFNELFDRMNSRINKGPGAKPLFKLNNNWRFSYTVDLPGGGKGTRTGVLQYILPVPAQQNVAAYEQRYVLNQWTDISQHTAGVLGAVLGSRIVDRPLRPGQEQRTDSNLQKWYDGTLLPDISEARNVSEAIGDGWFNPKDPVYDGWGMLNFAEHQVLLEGTAAMNQFIQTIDKSEWKQDPDSYVHYQELTKKILSKLNLSTHPTGRRLLDQFIRMTLGIPGPSKDQAADVGGVSVKDAVQALTAVLEHLNAGELPTISGVQPLIHADMLRLIFNAQQGANKPWGPKVKASPNGSYVAAKGWDEWVQTAIGQAFDSPMPFEAMQVKPLNGFWQTYNGTTALGETLTVTYDAALAVKLRSARHDGHTRDLVSFSEMLNSTLETPILLDSDSVGIEALTGRSVAKRGSDMADTPASRAALHAKRRAAWRAQKKMVKQDSTQTLADYRKLGARYLENNNRANVFMRNISMWSLINRMLNPGIWVSGLVELPVRRSFEAVTNLITGQSLSGPGANLPTSRYTPDEVKLLNDLIRQLGDNDLFIAEIQNQLTYSITGPRSSRSELGGFSGKLEDTAGALTRWMSDPYSGMRGDALAREYITAALEYLMLTNNAITIPQLVQQLKKNPLWLKEQFSDDKTRRFTPHQAGMNRVAQVRTMKKTMIAAPITGAINNLMARPGATANIAGHLLHIPFMFLTFNANTLTTLTGMSGWDQAIAMMFDKRRKPKFLRSKQNRETGVETVEDRWDFSDVIETIDLQRTFIRSGVTTSMLMALALMAGNLGLDGDDEEAKRRERLARYLHVPVVNDPYEPQNSFKYSRAIFLDSIPGLDMVFKDNRGEAAVVPHWIIRQFTSPILGIQRFFDTGDMREIGHGFWDAFSVVPNSVLRIWEDADAMASQLADMAQAESKYDSEEARLNTNQLLVNIVTTYEKAVLENSFVNTLYTAVDEFDRNPYLIPKINDTGQIVRQQGLGIPEATTATVADTDAQGNPITRYIKRTPDQAQVYAYTENNATAAVLASLFTGKFGESPFMRQNMVVKQRIIEMPETTEAQAEALILAAYKGAGGEFSLDKGETIRLLKAQDEAAGIYWDQADIERRADALIAAHSPELALSSLDPEGNEVITQAGAESIYRSLMKQDENGLHLGHPALRGIAISPEMRDKVGAKLVLEIMQDAIDKGLSYESAQFVANRFWFGDKTNPSVPGLRDLLQSKEIPYTNRVTYNQLNVMYAIGPDGRPWATPFERSNILQAAGIPLPHRVELPGPGTHLDNLGNVVDDVLGINTGVSAVVRQPEPEYELKDPFKDLPKNMSAGSGSGGRRYGGGGGGTYFPPFIRMDDLPYGTSSRYGGIPMINTSNPYIRRANVNRERVFGERGRLKQWQ